MQNESGGEDDKKFSIILIAVLLAIILVISSAYIFVEDPFYFFTSPVEEPGYTAIFENVTAQEAYDIINSTDNLTIIDCGYNSTGCNNCAYKNSGHIPGAILSDNDFNFFNSTNDILVYGRDEDAGAYFCLDLVDNVYGKVYNLNGGILAWKSAGLPLNYGPDP